MTATVTPAPSLTDADRGIVARARELAGANDLPALAAVTGAPPDLPVVGVHAEALGVAQYLLGELAAIADRLGGGNG